MKLNGPLNYSINSVSCRLKFKQYESLEKAEGVMLSLAVSVQVGRGIIELVCNCGRATP